MYTLVLKYFFIFTSRTSNAKSWDCTLSSSNFACFGVFTSKAFLFKKKCSLYYHFIIRYIVCLFHQLFHKDQARNWLLLPSTITMFFSLANTLVLQNFIQRLISLLVWGIFFYLMVSLFKKLKKLKKLTGNYRYLQVSTLSNLRNWLCHLWLVWSSICRSVLLCN